ncbi:MAG: hypothetical protein ACTSVY_03485 [Candidatus Helarchaeota archaeon]
MSILLSIPIQKETQKHFSLLEMGINNLNTPSSIWNSTWDTKMENQGNGFKMSADSYGNIYCIGQVNISNNLELIVIKYDSNGIELWNTTWGSTDEDCGFDILIDDYVSGLYALGEHQLTSNDYDLALVRFVPNNDTFEIPAYTNVTLDLGNLKLNISANVSLTINTSLFNSQPLGYERIANLTNAFYFLEILVNTTSHEVNATIQYHYNEEELPTGITEDNLDIFYLNGTAWESLNATINTAGNYIEVQVNHFSFYAIVGSATTPESPPANTPLIPGFESIFVVIALLSVISLVVLYQKLKSKKIEFLNF